MDRSILDATAFVRTGVEGVRTLLEAVRRAGRPMRFVQVGTDEVYGSRAAGSSREEDALAPRSPYAAVKAAGELLALAYHVTHRLDVVVTRGANTFGPFQHPEKLIPLIVTNALAEEPCRSTATGSSSGLAAGARTTRRRSGSCSTMAPPARSTTSLVAASGRTWM